MESRLEKYYLSLMGRKLVVNSKDIGMNWETTVILPQHTVTAIASTESESRELALAKAEKALVSRDIVDDSVAIIAKSTTRMAMLEKVYLENKTQYHTDNKLSIATTALANALLVNNSGGKVIIKYYRKDIVKENKESLKYLKQADKCISERIANSKEAIGKEHIPELSGELFQNFCDAYYSADMKGFRHLMAGILAVDNENGKLEIEGERYTLVV